MEAERFGDVFDQCTLPLAHYQSVNIPLIFCPRGGFFPGVSKGVHGSDFVAAKDRVSEFADRDSELTQVLADALEFGFKAAL